MLAGTAGGAQGGQHHSTGNVLPLVAIPWGMNHWAPQTVNDATSWWFDANSDTFRGIRCTHQPSPWIGDYGYFVLRPYLGYSQDEWLGFTSYHAASAVQPWGLDLSLGPAGVRIELAPTSHGAVLRVTFPASVPSEKRKICAWVPEGDKKGQDEQRVASSQKPTGECAVGDGGIDLISRRFSGGLPENSDFGLFVRLEADGGLRAEADFLSPTGCFEVNQQYMPMNMPGQERSQESDAASCQKRCASVEGCAHFVWWSDGGCHLQDKDAKQNPGPGLTAGPPHCPAEQGLPRQCCFLLDAQTEASIRIGTSFISAAQAARALDQEVGFKYLDTVRDEAQMAWRSHLSAVFVEDAGPPSATTLRRLEVFYTCLYRCLLFPRRLDENTPNGVQHWSPYSGKVRSGPGVTDNGFWDTFRTVYPLLALAYPRQLGEIVQGWLNAYADGGWLPKWASPGYRDSMVGTFADVVISDAIIKNISGFDRALAWEALRQDAFEENPNSKDTSRGKFGLQHYKSKGYIPVDVAISEACSRTLDFAFADAASARAAEALGHESEARTLRERSERALREMYDERTGMMGHKDSGGNFMPVPAETWGECFTEGSAWHHSFPPFDMALLQELHGGRDLLLDKLRELFTRPADFQVGSYKQEIHEMREMRMLGLGQYAHNNQPVHHLPFLFALLGDRNATARLVRRILSSAYSPEGFAGDEDNGEMGAWYVLSSLGLYATAPGVSENYVLASIPIFKRVHLRELDVRIEAPAAMQEAPLLSKVLWRGRQLPDVEVSYAALRQGGTLLFESMGDDRLSLVISSMRSAMHGAVRGVRAVAEVAQKKMRGPEPRPPAGNADGISALESVALVVVASLFAALALRTVCKMRLVSAEKPD